MCGGKEVLQEIAEKVCDGSYVQMTTDEINFEVSKPIYYMPEK